jgi:hypothetical protein
VVLAPQSGVSIPNSINFCISISVMLLLLLSTFKHKRVAPDALYCNSKSKNYLGNQASPVFSTPVRAAIGKTSFKSISQEIRNRTGQNCLIPA